MLGRECVKVSMAPPWSGEINGSGVRNARQEDPQQPVFPLGGDSALIITWRNLDLPFEPAVVDFHGYNPYRLARGGEGHLLLLKGFRRLPVSADPDAT